MTHNSEQFDRYCIGCRHSLRALTSNTCPECGRSFDPTDSSTTLSRPYSTNTSWLAGLGTVLTIVGATLTAMFFLSSTAGSLWNLGVVMLLIVTAIFWLACYAVAFLLACIPRLPLRPWVRTSALLLPFVAASILLTGWPFHLSFLAHRPWLNQIADRAQAGEAISVPFQLGLFRVQKVLAANPSEATIQVSGHSGGGLHLVRSASRVTYLRQGGSSRRVMDDEWSYYIED